MDDYNNDYYYCNANVTLGVNKDKGIRIISFVNPYTRRKTSRSLGKIGDIPEYEVLDLKRSIEAILSNFSYYKNYDNFRKEINSGKNLKAFNIIFKGSDNWVKLMSEKALESDESFISIIKNNKFCYEDSVAFIGQVESGKTSIILQVLGIPNKGKLVPIDNTYIKFNKKGNLKLSIIFSNLMECSKLNFLYKKLKNKAEILGAVFHSRFITNKGIIDDDFISKNTDILSVQFSLNYINKILDDDLRDIFLYAINEIIHSNKYSIRSLKVEGDFKPKMSVLSNIFNEKENLLLIDCKGIKSEVLSDNEFIRNICYAKKIIWLIDINTPFNENYVNILDMLKSGNYIDKTRIIFSKCDLYLNYSNDSLYDVGQSILYLIDSSFLNKDFHFLGDMNSHIVGSNFKLKIRGNIIKGTLNEKYKKGLSNIFLV